MTPGLSSGFKQVSAVQIPAPLLALLRASGAHACSHSGRTLMDHLAGTYQMLKSWQAPEDVCLAGLFHSVYGTNAFHRQSLAFTERHKVRSLIGAEAEELAWIFCSVERPQAFLDCVHGSQLLSRHDQAQIHCTPDTLSKLLEIECANLIEQSGRNQALESIFCEVVDDRDLISEAAYRATKHHLSHQFRKQPSALAEAKA
jgi:hypothetical protein